MKKLLCISLLLCGITQVSVGQDIITLKDGGIINAKVVYEDSATVKYKLLSNLTGPTWVKSKASIRSIKRAEERPRVIDFSSCDGRKRKKNKKCPSGESIVAALDSIYEQGISAWRNMAWYVANLPSCIQENCIRHFYLENFKNACAVEETGDILRYGVIYLYLGGEDEKAEVISIIAKIYAREEDEAMVGIMIRLLEEYSKENDDLFDTDIERLKEETHKLLHPYRWEESIRGKWVMLNRITDEAVIELQSPTILEIKDVTKPFGANLLIPSQKIPKGKNTTASSESYYTKQINISQSLVFRGLDNYAVIQFASMSVKDRRWMTDIVTTTLETNRKTSAEMLATIRSYGKVSLEERLAASLATELTFATLNALVKTLNTSSKNDQVYNIVLFPRDTNVINSFVSHVDVTTLATSGETPKSVYNKHIKDRKNLMVRWEESDSVYFVSRNKQIISLSPMSINDELFEEYNSIKRKHSLRNPAYFIPMITGTLLSGYIIKKGVDYNYESYERDEFGNKIPNGLGGYLFDSRKTAKAVICWTGGALLCMSTIMGIPMIISNNREKAFIQLNRRNVEKLRRKASVDVTMLPTYDIEHDCLGANLNISF